LPTDLQHGGEGARTSTIEPLTATLSSHRQWARYLIMNKPQKPVGVDELNFLVELTISTSRRT